MTVSFSLFLIYRYKSLQEPFSWSKCSDKLAFSFGSWPENSDELTPFLMNDFTVPFLNLFDIIPDGIFDLSINKIANCLQMKLLFVCGKWDCCIHDRRIYDINISISADNLSIFLIALFKISFYSKHSLFSSFFAFNSF